MRAMREYEVQCRDDGNKRLVMASNPLSALKKASRSGSSFHWIECKGPPPFWHFVVRLNGVIVMYCESEDNG